MDISEIQYANYTWTGRLKGRRYENMLFGKHTLTHTTIFPHNFQSNYAFKMDIDVGRMFFRSVTGTMLYKYLAGYHQFKIKPLVVHDPYSWYRYPVSGFDVDVVSWQEGMLRMWETIRQLANTTRHSHV